MNAKRYRRLYKSTGDYKWLLKYAEDMENKDSGPMSFFDVPTVGEYSKYLVYGNTLPEDDDVQKRFGYVLANGLANLYADKKLLDAPALVDWKFGDPEKVLSEVLHQHTPEDITSVSLFAIGLLNTDKNPEDKRVKRLLSDPNAIKDGIRYAFVRAAQPFYNYFVFKNPLVDFLPQDFGESEAQLAFDAVPLTASQLKHIIKNAAKKESRAETSDLISTYKGPRLDDLAMAYKIAQVKLLMSSEKTNDRDFARLQFINDGQFLHTQQGLEALKRYMANESNRKERYKPSINFNYEFKEGDDLREIVTQLDGNIQNVIQLNKKQDPDFDIDNVEPGTVVRLNARTELLTDNMFVGEITAGRSYGSLSKALRKARPTQNKKKLEVEDEEQISGKFLYYKTWDGRPDFYSRPVPKSAYIAKGFVEDVIAKDPQEYKAQLTNRLLDSVATYIDYSLSTVSESRDDVVQLAEGMGNNTLAATNLYKDFMSGVKGAITDLNVDDSTLAYKDAVSRTRDNMLQKYRAYLTDVQSVYGNLSNLLPSNIATGNVSFVMNENGSTKLANNDLTNYYKNDLGGLQVLSVLEDKNGYLTEKYVKNENDYKKWLDQYGETKVTQSIEKVAEDKDRIDDTVLAKLGIPPYASVDNKQFAQAIWQMCRDIPTVEELREKLDGIDERALFVYLEDRLLEAYPDIKQHVSKNYLKIAIRGQQKMTLLEEGEQLAGGRSESRKEVARRVLETGESDVAEFFSEAEESRYKHFKMNGEVHTYAIGGYLQKRYSPTTDSQEYFNTFEVEEKKGSSALVNAIKKNYSFNMGRQHVYRRNKEDLRVLRESKGIDLKDLMQEVGAFADPQKTYNNVVAQREAQAKIDEVNKELAGFERSDELSADEKKRQNQLQRIVRQQERIIKNSRYDTAYKAFDRAFSNIGRVPPHLLKEAITDYFAGLKNKYVNGNPALAKLIVPFSKEDSTTNDPFQHEESPRKMSENQLLTLFDRSVNIESTITEPLESFSGQVSSLTFDDKESIKAFTKQVRTVLGRIEKRPTLDVGEAMEQIRQLLAALSKAKGEEEFRLIVQSIADGLDVLNKTVTQIFESSQEEISSWIDDMPMAPEISSAEKAAAKDPDEPSVTNKATAYRYIQSLEMLSEDEKLSLGDLALTKMSAEQFANTDTFVRNLLISANKEGIEIRQKEDLVLAHDAVLDMDAMSDEEEILEDITEDKTGMKDRIDIYMSKYKYLKDISDNDISEIDFKDLRNILTIVSEGAEEGSVIIDALNNLNDQEYSVIEEDADEAEEFAAGVLPALKTKLEREINKRLSDLPVSEKQLDEEEVVEVSRNLPLADQEDIEILEQVPSEDFQILEEQPVGIQFKPDLGKGFPLGFVSGETVPEGSSNWVYDEENNVRYSVVKNVEPGWHGIRWKEELAQVEEAPTDVLGDIAQGLRDLVDTQEEILDQDTTGSAYTNILDFASKLDGLVGGAVLSPESLPTLVNLLLSIVQKPTAENILGYFTSNNYPSLVSYLNVIVQPKKTSNLKLEISSAGRFHTVKTTVVEDDRDFYYF